LSFTISKGDNKIKCYSSKLPETIVSTGEDELKQINESNGTTNYSQEELSLNLIIDKIDSIFKQYIVIREGGAFDKEKFLEDEKNKLIEENRNQENPSLIYLIKNIQGLNLGVEDFEDKLHNVENIDELKSLFFTFSGGHKRKKNKSQKGGRKRR
jgi:hypothetical protein